MILFIVPTLNEEKYLPILLQSFVEQDYDQPYEIVIVDGGSTDKTVETALKFKMRLPILSTHECKRGIGRQRNFGVTQASSENIVFLDADMKLSSGCLKRIAHHFESNQKDFIATPFICTYNGRFIDYILAALAYLYTLIVRRTAPIATGMCMMTTKSSHERVNGFNEEMKYAEDIDYGLRAHKLGIPQYIYSNVQVRTSTRRLDRTGRLKVAKTWLSWYKQLVKNGKLDIGTEADYNFGDFKK